jgi:replicative DNA helicase
MAVLGGMMLSQDALGDCLDMLTPGSFLRPAHQIIFEVISALADEGKPTDPVAVETEVNHRGQLSKVGGADYFHDLIASVPLAANAPFYGRALLERQTSRDLALAASRIGQIAAEPDMARTERIDAAHQALDEVTGTAVKTGGVPASELVHPLLEALAAGPDNSKGIPSGWHDLDEVIPGFRPGEITIIGARPGMGKSVVLLNIAANAAMKLSRTVLAVSLEMSRSEYMERLLAAHARVSLTKLRDGTLDEADWAAVRHAQGPLFDADKLIIHDGPELSVQGIRAELRAMRRAGRPADLVTVDYMTLVSGTSKRPESRQLEVSDISRRLKLLAREFEVPILVGSQLNRGPEQRSDHRPLLADLRESGSVEQDSDIVILLYREDAYVEDSPRSGEIDLIVAKNRQGPKATVTLAFQGHYATVADMYRTPDPTPLPLEGAA